QPAVYAYLLRNVEANHASNIRLHQRAVCDAVGSAELSLLPDPSLAFLTPQNRGRKASSSVPVSTISLDHFHRSVGLTPHLIKVDVEGAEQLVLEGAQDVIGMEPDAP